MREESRLRTVTLPVTIQIAGALVECKDTITLLGVPFDANLIMDKFVNSKVSSMNYHIRSNLFVRLDHA
jgi:hypothetical protein